MRGKREMGGGGKERVLALSEREEVSWSKEGGKKSEERLDTILAEGRRVLKEKAGLCRRRKKEKRTRKKEKESGRKGLRWAGGEAFERKVRNESKD